jgi:hypothetical protein
VEDDDSAEASMSKQNNSVTDGFFNMTAIESGAKSGGINPEVDDANVSAPTTMLSSTTDILNQQDDSIFTLQNEVETIKKTKQPKQKVSYKVWYCVPAKPQFIVQKERDFMSKAGGISATNRKPPSRSASASSRPKTPVLNLSNTVKF